LCRIKGVADDRLSFSVTRDKDGPLVHFTFHAGAAKGPDGHLLTVSYAISKGVRISGYADGKKITSVEELGNVLRDTK
jgi:hypothetical protein